MAHLTILGSAYAVPNPDQENTHLALVLKQSAVLIDCSGTPLVRLEKAGIPLDWIDDIILTHFHPDHASGLPTLLMGMWLKGRKKPLTVHGLEITVAKASAMMDLFDWHQWPGFFDVRFHGVPEIPLQTILRTPEVSIVSSPVRHLIPTIGLRIQLEEDGVAAAYSCDTEPCQAVVDLAAGADLLIHEAAGEGKGHSSPYQAGEIARQAEVGKLVMIHYGPGQPAEALIHQAKTAFQGQVDVARDWMVLPLDGITSPK